MNKIRTRTDAARVVEEEEAVLLVPVAVWVPAHYCPVGVDGEGADFSEHAKQARRPRPALQPQHDGGVRVSVQARQVP